ncbi:MAG TPA: hypothetical protein VFZ96_08915 [Actinomycetota bacterium]|nr:hypothetical protein [Actinomycetota bacterium]
MPGQRVVLGPEAAPVGRGRPARPLPRLRKGPEDAPTIRAKAAALLTKADEHAASLAASAEAERYFERALDLTDDTLSLAGLHERAGQMARRAGDFETGARTLRDRDRAVSALRAMNNSGAFEGQADRWESVIDHTSRGLDLARRVGDRSWEQSFLLGSMEELTYLGRRDEVEAALQAMPPMDEMPEGLRLNVWSAVQMLVLRGELERARELLGSTKTAATSEDLQAWMAAHRLEAMLLLADGHPVESLAAAEKVIDAQDSLGERAPEFKEGLIRAMEAASALRDEAKLEEILGRSRRFAQARSRRICGLRALGSPRTWRPCAARATWSR